MVSDLPCFIIHLACGNNAEHDGFDVDVADADDEPPIFDSVLDDTVHLLTSLASNDSVASDARVDACLYAYQIMHHQAYFSSHTDRLLGMDEGRVAELLLQSSELLYPKGEYGSNFWARVGVEPLVSASLAFLKRKATLSGEHGSDIEGLAVDVVRVESVTLLSESVAEVASDTTVAHTPTD